MPKIQSTIQKQNLQKFNVWIEDTAPGSDYFKIKQAPDILTAGKNSLLLEGTEMLQSNTEVRIELLDAEGNTVFIKSIKNYIEGLARVLSIEIYHDTPPGPATLTILGVLRYDKDGNIPPKKFQNAYNCRYTKSFVIDPTQNNTSPIRLWRLPKLHVSEILIPYKESVISQLTSSAYTVGNATLAGFSSRIIYNENNQSSYAYYFRLASPTVKFSRFMNGGNITASVNSNIYTSSIRNVISDTLIEVDPIISASHIIEFATTNNFTMSYYTPITYTPTGMTRSFADIDLYNLETITGDIRRVKMFVKSVDSFGTYEQVSDNQFTANKLMITQSSAAGIIDVDVGQIIDQNTITTYWRTGSIKDIGGNIFSY